MNTMVKEGQPSALEHARLLRDLDALMNQGKSDSDEADSIRDQMDRSWYAMSEHERKRMEGLSEDLYTLAQGGAKRIEMTAEEREAWREQAKHTFAEWKKGDIDGTLDFLRRLAPKEIPPFTIPFMQSRCWERLGDLGTALVFMKEAERHDPHQAALVMLFLQQLGDLSEAAAYARKIIKAANSTPEEIALAGATLVWETREMATQERQKRLKEYAPVFRQALTKARSVLAGQRDFDSERLLILLLGLCYEELNDYKAAIQIYDEGLKKKPGDAELLSLRGLVKYYQNDPRAYEDLNLAAAGGARTVWTYALLAQKFFREGQHLNCVVLCNRAVQMDSRPEIKAGLHQLLGMSYAMLGQSVDWIDANFSQAEALDSKDPQLKERWQQSRDIAVSRAAPPTWQLPPKADRKTVHWTTFEAFRHDDLLRRTAATEALLLPA